MAKSLKSIYFESELIIEAEKQDLNLNSICNEALRLTLNKDSATGEKIRNDAEARKDEQVLVRCSTNRSKSRMGAETWRKVVTAYAQKYKMDIEDVLRRFN